MMLIASTCSSDSVGPPIDRCRDQPSKCKELFNCHISRGTAGVPTLFVQTHFVNEAVNDRKLCTMKHYLSKRSLTCPEEPCWCGGILWNCRKKAGQCQPSGQAHSTGNRGRVRGGGLRLNLTERLNEWVAGSVGVSVLSLLCRSSVKRGLNLEQYSLLVSRVGYTLQIQNDSWATATHCVMRRIFKAEVPNHYLFSFGKNLMARHQK